MKFATRLILLAALGVGGYFLVSWYVPRRAAQRDLAGIEARLEAIERDLAILVDRVQAGRGAEPAATPPVEEDERFERMVTALEALTQSLGGQDGDE